jgi:hypothetical protein
MGVLTFGSLDHRAHSTPEVTNKPANRKAFVFIDSSPFYKDPILGTLQSKGVVKRYHASRERENFHIHEPFLISL